MFSKTILGLFAMLAFCAGGCAAEAGDEIDDQEEQGETESDLTNQGISGTKLCFKMKAEAKLYTTPTGNEEVANNGGAVKIPAGKSRYVLVQRKPGQVKGRVWAHVNFSGLTAKSDEKVLVDRCNLDSIAEARELIAVARGDRHPRRGWMDVSALASAASKLPASLPNGPAFSANELDSNGKPKAGELKTVLASCTVPQSYFGGSKTNPTSMEPYGTAGLSQMYVSYGTTEKDGGGITFAYVDVGSQVHFLGKHVHKQTGEHCQATANEVGAKCNGDVPRAKRARRMWWAEIWADVDGQTVRGFVPNDCLE